MNNFLVELDYIKNHFPEFVMDTIPKVLIVLIILQIVLGLVRFSVRNYETGRAEQIKSGTLTVSLILWVTIAVLMGVDLYYYITYVKS